MNDNRQRGFTLIEMMVVGILLLVLLLLVLPAFQGQVIDVRRGLAWAELFKLTVRQEQFLLDHGRYADDLTELGLNWSPYALDTQGSAVSAAAEQRVYIVSLVTRRSGYSVMATPQLSQAGDRLCGTIIMDDAGRRLTAGTGTLAQCR